MVLIAIIDGEKYMVHIPERNAFVQYTQDML